MKVLVAVDSFKGTLTSQKIASLFKQHMGNGEHTFDLIPIGDGGEGTVDSLHIATNGEKVHLKVRGPFSNIIDTYYVLSPNKKTAMIEIALSSGLGMISKQNLNPFATTTYGLGETICHALNQGVTELIVGIGGSSTNDGGAGMLQALGVVFLDKDGLEIKNMTGHTIGLVDKIDISGLDTRIKKVHIKVACDVDNPLLGPRGCAEVYSRQKGASKEMVLKLEKNMEHYANIVEKTINTDFRNHPGTGAAGGLGFGFVAFLSAYLMSGLDIVADATNLTKRVQEADVVITGEGHFDNQSLHGKVPVRVAQIARDNHKKVIGVFALSSISEKPELFDEIHTVVPTITTKKESLKNPEKALISLIKSIKI